MNIFLDDEREIDYLPIEILNEFNNSFTIIRNYNDFKSIIDDNITNIKFISFDHDIASFENDKEYTGKDAVEYLINKCIELNIELPSWYIHSSNTVGKQNMISYILTYLKIVENKNINFRNYNNGIINNIIV